MAVIILVRSSTQWRVRFALFAAAGLVVCTAGVYTLRNVPVVQNTLFHTDNSSRSAESSNEGRLAALENGVRDVVHEPVGRGPGTAGPESTRNNHPARIAENYYLQIGQEVGWVGMTAFVAITMLAGQMLWTVRRNPLALGLLAALAGLTAVNMLSHAWSDDTLGLLWWGLAGSVVGSAILTTEATRQTHENTHTKKTAKRS